MSKGGLFIIDTGNQLTPLVPTPYETEDLFQRLLADHPEVIGGVSGRPDGRLLLVRREAPVPEEMGGAGRWSLDHLFIDQDAVPVLVEIKRSNDTRARREVVAQMLDYAANGVAYWPIDHIVNAFRERAAGDEQDPDALLDAFMDGNDAEAFWRQVESNLRSGRIRMLIVADRIGSELRRIVEFLNEQMRSAEIMALEVDQHTTPDGLRLLSSRLVGATERAASTKAVRPAEPRMELDEWLDDLAVRHGSAAGAAAREIAAWLSENGLTAGVSSSQDSVSFRVTGPDGQAKWPFFIRRSTGRFEIALRYLKNTVSFTEEAARQALLDQLKAAMPDLVASDRLTGWPAIPLERLGDDNVNQRLKVIAIDVTAKLQKQG